MSNKMLDIGITSAPFEVCRKTFSDMTFVNTFLMIL